MVNYIYVFYYKLILEECVEVVRKQFYFGEGVIQWVGEVVVCVNCDLFFILEIKSDFLKVYEKNNVKKWF